jgi:ABC-type glycerol-3-phosphate transport system substrate-binding protein
VFLSGAVAMMVNWFGFAARCDRPGSPLRGKVAIAPVPADPGKPAVSLSVFWTLGIGSGSKHKQQAYDFLHFLTQTELDKKWCAMEPSACVSLRGGMPKCGRMRRYTAKSRRYRSGRVGCRGAAACLHLQRF